MESTHISSRVDACGRGFLSLAERLTDTPQFAAQIGPQDVTDEFDRFKLWAGNISAHRKGRRSLEYRLRDAAHLKIETQNLLTALQESFVDALAIVKHERIPWDEVSDSDSDSGSDAQLLNDTQLQGDTELKQLFASIKNTVTCLFRLSMSIRDPAPNSQFRSTITVDKSYFQPHDIQHVKEKFGTGNSYLVERLGRAVSGRRQYLTYREEHHQKLTKNVEKIGFEEPRTEHTTNSTEASPMPQVLNDVTSTGVGDDSEDALSQTSYATSVNSTIRVPALPKEAREQEHFECPFCYMIVSIHTTAAWKQHVYRDLHPYCCTFESCTTADRLYDSRHAWFRHELEAHRTSWQCMEGCDNISLSEQDFHAHVLESHPDIVGENMLLALKRTAARSANLADRADCPLCDKSMSLRALQKHLGHHQEQLALFALPPNLEETEDEPQDSEFAELDVNNWQDKEVESDDEFSDGGEADEDDHPAYRRVVLNGQEDFIWPEYLSASPRRCDKARQLLQEHPEFIHQTNSTLYPQAILSLKARKEIPYDITTWGQLKELFYQSHGSVSISDISKVEMLQILHFMGSPDYAEPLPGASTVSHTLEKEHTREFYKEKDTKEAEKSRDRDAGPTADTSTMKQTEEKILALETSTARIEAALTDSQAHLESTANMLEHDDKIAVMQRLLDENGEQFATEPSDDADEAGALNVNKTAEKAIKLVEEITAELDILENLLKKKDIPLETAETRTTSASNSQASLIPDTSSTQKENEERKNTLLGLLARVSDVERMKEEEDRKKAEDAKFTRIEDLLILQQTQRMEMEARKKRAAEEAAAQATEAKRKGDEDKLLKLEKLILAQKDEQLKREAAVEAATAARAADASATATKEAAEKAAAADMAAKLLHAAKTAREEAEAKAAKDAEEMKAAYEKALAEAKIAAEELQKAKQAAEEEVAKLKPSDAPKAPIRFKDAVGRKFSFPWHLCKTWKGMEELIKQAFLHVDMLGPHVQEGHYDLVGPDNEIILPQVWETMVQPGWEVTMHMWPMPESQSTERPLEYNRPQPSAPRSERKTTEQGRRRWHSTK